MSTNLRIQRYVDSRGSDLPRDVQRNHCAFCTTPLSIESPYSVSIPSSSHYACMACAKRTIDVVHGDPNPGVLYDEEYDNRDYRKYMLWRYGKYSRDVSRHYLHLRNYPGSRNSCYCCERRNGEKNHTFVVPVTYDPQEFIGGEVGVCDLCVAEASDKGLGPIPQLGLRVRCASCRDEYTVTKEELSYRTNFTKAKAAKYCCPRCVCKQLEDLFEIYGGVASPYSQSRISDLQCSYCHSYTRVDLMQYFEGEDFDLPLEEVARATKHCCEVCRIDGEHPTGTEHLAIDRLVVYRKTEHALKAKLIVLPQRGIKARVSIDNPSVTEITGLVPKLLGIEATKKPIF